MQSQRIQDLQGSSGKRRKTSSLPVKRGCIRDSYQRAIMDLSSPAGPAPLGSFIFVLMAALDNGAAEKSPKSKGSTSDVTGHPFPPVDWCSRVHMCALLVMRLKVVLHDPNSLTDVAPKMRHINALYFFSFPFNPLFPPPITTTTTTTSVEMH